MAEPKVQWTLTLGELLNDALRWRTLVGIANRDMSLLRSLFDHDYLRLAGVFPFPDDPGSGHIDTIMEHMANKMGMSVELDPMDDNFAFVRDKARLECKGIVPRGPRLMAFLATDEAIADMKEAGTIEEFDMVGSIPVVRIAVVSEAYRKALAELQAEKAEVGGTAGEPHPDMEARNGEDE